MSCNQARRIPTWMLLLAAGMALAAFSVSVGALVYVIVSGSSAPAIERQGERR